MISLGIRRIPVQLHFLLLNKLSSIMFAGDGSFSRAFDWCFTSLSSGKFVLLFTNLYLFQTARHPRNLHVSTNNKGCYLCFRYCIISCLYPFIKTYTVNNKFEREKNIVVSFKSMILMYALNRSMYPTSALHV